MTCLPMNDGASAKPDEAPSACPECGENSCARGYNCLCRQIEQIGSLFGVNRYKEPLVPAMRARAAYAGALEADARRYRFLRDAAYNLDAVPYVVTGPHGATEPITGAELDKAIDERPELGSEPTASILATNPEGSPEYLQREEVTGVGHDSRKLWLWRNFVDGRPEYWAFDNPFPIHLDNEDPQTLGEPCGYALLKPSRNGRPFMSDEAVLRHVISERDLRTKSFSQTPEGWKLVPVEPTDAMLEELYSGGPTTGDDRLAFVDAYKGMLAAAPICEYPLDTQTSKE